METKCENCEAVREESDLTWYYCVECREVLCYGCVGAQHMLGTRKGGHCLERIIGTGGYWHLWVDVVGVAVVLWGAWRVWGLEGHTYMRTQHCPVVVNVHKALLYDALANYHLKHYWAICCDQEDSLWRFFTDAYYRAVVTQTDSWYLLILHSKAAVISCGLLLFIAPLFYQLFAFSAMVVHIIEARILPTPPNAILQATRGLLNAVGTPLSMVYELSKITPVGTLYGGLRLLGDGQVDKGPPPRTAPAQGRHDWKYWVRRHTRYYTYYYTRMRASFERAVLVSLSLTFVFRFTALWLDLTSLFPSHTPDPSHPEPIPAILESLLTTLLDDLVSVPTLVFATTLSYMLLGYLWRRFVS